MSIPTQTPQEEKLNSLSHIAIGVMGIVALFFIVNKVVVNHIQNGLLSGIIYGLSFITLFLASGFYHLVKKEEIKKIFRVIDHCSIFILIAGTYTPLALSYIGGTEGWVLFTIQWAIAIVGICLKIFYTGRFEIISVVFYLIMGWMIAYKVPEMYGDLSITGFLSLVMGGVFYTFGIVFYLLDSKVKYFHFVWHIFVALGAISHFVFIYFYVY